MEKKKIKTNKIKHNEIDITLSVIADIIGAKLIGDDIVVNSISAFDHQVENSLSIISSLDAIKFINGKASAYLINEDFMDKIDVTTKPLLEIKASRLTLVKLMNIFYPKKEIKNYIAPNAVISKRSTISSPINISNFVVIGEDTDIGSYTTIMSNSVIGDSVSIGSNCIIYPNVTIYDNCKIGDNVIIHSGSVIGADGFGFIPADIPIKIPQHGNVIIEDNVEIGANTCIDRATLGSTIISIGTKIDDLVMIGHNTKIGKSCLIASQVGFSGSITTGDNIIVAGQVGFSDHINIASNTIFGGQSGIPKDIKEPGLYLGSPCMPMLKYAKSLVVFEKLPELQRRVKKIENENN